MIRPSLHPNGFIQYDLPSVGGRLHIWHPNLPVAQIVHTPIHDHTFNFTSKIVLGRLTHVNFNFYERDNGAYQLHGATAVMDGGDTILEPLGIVGDMVNAVSHTFGVGERYTFEAGLFHLSEGDGLTATIMVKTATGLRPFPRIAVPVGVDPDNNFRRHQCDAGVLAGYVEMVLDMIDITEAD